MPLPLTTKTRTASFPQREDIRLVLKFSKSKSKNIVTHFHSFGTGSIPYTLVFASHNCNDYYIFSYTHMYLQVFLAFTKELVRNKHAVEEVLAKINLLQFGFVGITNIEANVYEVVRSQQLSFNCWGCRSLFRKSCFSGCINRLSQIIKRFCSNIRFDYFNEVLFCHLASSPKSYKSFSGHAL